MMDTAYGCFLTVTMHAITVKYAVRYTWSEPLSRLGDYKKKPNADGTRVFLTCAGLDRFTRTPGAVTTSHASHDTFFFFSFSFWRRVELYLLFWGGFLEFIPRTQRL